MMIFSLVAMTGLEKCCITSAYLQWLCHSGERPVARGPLVFFFVCFVLLVFGQILKYRKNKSAKGSYELIVYPCFHPKTLLPRQGKLLTGGEVTSP